MCGSLKHLQCYESGGSHSFDVPVCVTFVRKFRAFVAVMHRRSAASAMSQTKTKLLDHLLSFLYSPRGMSLKKKTSVYSACTSLHNGKDAGQINNNIGIIEKGLWETIKKITNILKL